MLLAVLAMRGGGGLLAGVAEGAERMTEARARWGGVACEPVEALGVLEAVMEAETEETAAAAARRYETAVVVAAAAARVGASSPARNWKRATKKAWCVACSDESDLKTRNGSSASPASPTRAHSTPSRARGHKHKRQAHAKPVDMHPSQKGGAGTGRSGDMRHACKSSEPEDGHACMAL